jgi:hypothetical protein
MAKVMKKAQSGGIMDTKLKDVPKKVKSVATNAYDKVSNRVKNATVGDAVDVMIPGARDAYKVVKSLNNPTRKKPILKSKNGSKIIKKAQKGVKATADSTKYYEKKSIADARKSNNTLEIYGGGSKEFGNSQDKLIGSLKSLNRQPKKGKPGYDANGFPVKKAMKAGGMLKRADGSYSKRGLWDNIRANKGSGKKPTAQMLKQEKKIKAKTK